MGTKKFFFGWSNIKWFVKEIMNTFTDKPTYFSKKRIESGIAFAIAQYGMVYFIIQHVSTMTSSDIALWAGVEFAIAGYVINQIQKEKKNSEQQTGE